jgi:Galactose oxidase, central domain
VADTVRGVLVLYGGMNPGPAGGLSLDETWEWNGLDWTQVATTNSPGGRGRYGAAYDLPRLRTVLYGGIVNSLLLGATNTTWEYDGTTWTQIATIGNPGPLHDPAMCYSAVLGRTLLFGGNNPLVGVSGATWSYDGTSWTQVAVAGPSPAPRYQARMLYDASRGLCVLHGGIDQSGTLLDDTWEFDGATWTQQLGAGPSPRRGFGFAFDSARGTCVLFGGVGQPVTGLTDTWQYGSLFEAFGAGCVGSAGVPTLVASGGPRLATAFQSFLVNVIPAAPLAVMATGFSRSVFAGGVPLPLDMGPSGMPGCTLFIDPVLVNVIGATAGVATSSLDIPGDPYFLGVEFFQQGFSFEFPGWNQSGGVLSNAARCVTGH